MSCRVCLRLPKLPLNIFDQEHDIASVLQQHFWFEPLPNDGQSELICTNCWIKIREFHQFYLEVEKIHLELHAKYAASTVNVNVDQLDVPVLSNYIDTNVQEILEEKVEKPQIGDVLETVKNPLYEPELEVAAEPTNDVLAEVAYPVKEAIKEEVFDDIPIEQVNVEPVIEMIEEDVSCSTIAQRTKKRGRKKGFRLSQLSKLKVEGDEQDEENEKEEENKDTKELNLEDEQQASGSKKYNLKKRKVNSYRMDETERKPRQKKRLIIANHDTEIVKKHISMNCHVCSFVGDDFTKLCDHFKQEHPNSRPYVTCCDRKIFKRAIVIQHAYRHENPEFFKCTECKKVFADGYGLRAHMMANHAPEEDLKYGCDQCSKRFSRRHLLDLHKPSHIPLHERKYSCEKCPQSKPFASEHLLLIHTNMRHTRDTNVCHVCAKSIRDNRSFEKHVRLHFEDSGPRVKCPHPDCDRWLKDEDNLKQHMRRHNDEGKIFTCAECSKVCKNRRSLTSHYNYAHSNESHVCELCNKAFKKAITLKEHMAQHTGESLYKCPFCPRTFNSNANMHSHKKKMHPIEWDIWRKTKRGSSQHEASNKYVLETVAKSVQTATMNASMELNNDMMMVDDEF